MPIEVSRVKRHGNSLTVTIPKKILSDIPLKHGDQVAMRVAGAKLIMERIPLETLSRFIAQGDGIDPR
jgi:antitoxin component of MazEF toxin-antitoxin module